MVMAFLKKFLDIVKSTVILWICVLIPLLFGMKLVQNSAKKDARAYVDSFIRNEGGGLSRYVGLQLENTKIYVDNTWLQLKVSGKKLDTSPKYIHKKLLELKKNDENIVAINVYKEDGKLLATSLAEDDKDKAEFGYLDIDSKRIKDLQLNTGMTYSIAQLDMSKTVVVKYACKREREKKIFFEVVMKWEKYESYMNNLSNGAFPRLFCIVSPDFKRYISLNAFPKLSFNQDNMIALGLHLVNRLPEISEGLSNIRIDSFTFRIYKSEIASSDSLQGNPLYVVVASDNSSLEKVSECLLSNVPMFVMILTVVWLVLCIVISFFYNRTKKKLRFAKRTINSIPLSVAIFRASDGKIIKINASGMSTFRIEKEDIKHTDLWRLFLHEDDRSYVSSSIESNINILNYEVLMQSFEGGSFWVICSATPIDVDGEKYIVLAAIDINRRKEIEKKLANNAAHLERQVAERGMTLEAISRDLKISDSELRNARIAVDKANSAKDKFLTGMSNELKTPINAIVSYSETLQEESLDRNDIVSHDDLRKIIGSAKHLMSLIDEIIALSKVETGKTQIFLANVEISDIIKDIEGLVMPLINYNDNSLFLDYNREIGSMYTDATKLRQCLLKLLSNSAKYTQFGKVTLRVATIVKEGLDYIEFTIIDSGAGIQSDKLALLFESFQCDSSPKSSGISFSFGLPITKKYIEFLGGNIAAESEIGVGSKFVVRIPRIAQIKSNEFIELKNDQTDENVLGKKIMEEIGLSAEYNNWDS